MKIANSVLGYTGYVICNTAHGYSTNAIVLLGNYNLEFYLSWLQNSHDINAASLYIFGN